MILLLLVKLIFITSSSLVLGFFLYLLYCDIRNRLLFRKVKEIPSVPPIPLFGHVKHIAEGEASPRNELYYFDAFGAGEEGDFVKYCRFEIPTIISRSPAVYKQALVSEFWDKDLVYVRLQPYNGYSALPVQLHRSLGNVWKAQRHLLQAPFRPRLLKNIQHVFQKGAADLVTYLRDNVGKRVNMSSKISDVSLDVIARVIGAKDCPPDFLPTVLQISRNLISHWLAVPWIGKYVHKWRMRDKFAKVDAYIYWLINHRRKQVEQKMENEEEEEDGELDLLELLLKQRDEQGQGMTDKEIRDHVFSFFIAGQENTANVLNYMLFLLLKHPEVMAKLKEELASVEQPLRFDDIKRLTYVDWVSKEALRLFPPIVYIARTISKPTRLAETDIVVPAGFSVVLSIYGMQRDKRWWGEDADEFRPERWAQPPRNKYAYGPFSSGPRECLGKFFNHHEICTILHALLTNFDFELTDDPLNGVPVRENGLLRPAKVEVMVRPITPVS